MPELAAGLSHCAEYGSGPLTDSVKFNAAPVLLICRFCAAGNALPIRYLKLRLAGDTEMSGLAARPGFANNRTGPANAIKTRGPAPRQSRSIIVYLIGGLAGNCRAGLYLHPLMSLEVPPAAGT